MKSNFALLLLVFVAAGIVASSAFAAVPILISHQGRLLDSSSDPVDVPVDITFQIYDAPTGGNLLWTELHEDVPVNDGLFSVTLGSLEPLTSSILTITSVSGLDVERFLQFTIGNDPPVVTRVRLVSSPYSVASSRMSGDVETLPGELSLSGMSGSTTATIRSSSNPGDPGSEVELVDGNGSTTATIRAASTTGGQVHLGGMSGSTTGTIRMQATPDSADHEITIVDVLTGTTSNVNLFLSKTKSISKDEFLTSSGSSENEVTCDATGARSILSGMSGSTTGTIRMAASPDSSKIEGGSDADGDGLTQGSYKLQSGFIYSSQSMAFDSDDDGLAESSLDDQCDAGSARSTYVGRSGSTTGTIRMAASSDSTSFIQLADADGDGIAERQFFVIVSAADPGASGTFGLEADSDDDGNVDMSAETVCDATTVSFTLLDSSSDPASIEFRLDNNQEPTVAIEVGSVNRCFISPDSGIQLSNSSSVKTMDCDDTGDMYLASSLKIGTTGGSNHIEVVGGANCDGTTWNNASDANAKENFEPVDGEEILDKISDLNITRWNYKGNDDVEHIGPTAQDFKDAFGVGANDKSISTIDPSGIALAAIKELNKQNQELAKQNSELKKELENLKKKVDELISQR
ncbi:MAG: tail fiber domain-containing protein [Candidatus Zixiibacteriota bacterium]